MAVGKASDFTIYHEEYYGGMYESIVQAVQVFNAASANCLQLSTEQLKGEYEKETFLKSISNLISRRDTTSVAAATSLAMTQGELVGVKVNRKIGPIEQTLDSWRKIAEDQREMSFKLGKMIGEEKMKDYANTLILALEAALEGQSNLVYDYSGTGTLTHGALVSGLAKFGDQAQRIRCWVMHSKPYFDLVGQSISDKITNVADVTIYGGTAATLGRPTLVTDAAALFDANGSATDTYNVLGLVEGAGILKESELEEIESQVITGLENLTYRIQGEYAFNVACKGFAWDVANGAANPTDGALGTTTNWDKVATEDKNLAGVRIKVQ